MWALRAVAATIALSVGSALAWSADLMPWQPSLEAARQAAGSSNRLVLIHFWSTSCKPCMRLEREVFSQPEVAKALSAHFVMVKLNVDDSPGTARVYGVSSIPADVIVSPSGQLVSQMQSPPSANQYVTQLSRVATGYRDLTRQTLAGAVQKPAASAQAAPPTGVRPPQSASGTRPRESQPVPVNHAPPPNAAPARAASGPPRATPPVALEGYCPVTLVEKRNWVHGQPAYGVIHRGSTYLFAGPAEAERFFASPDRYCPVMSGADPVLALDERVSVPGRREFGVFSDNRIYLFANPETRRRFEQNPSRYAAEALQAMR